jgi:hypothetical protein
MTVALGMLGFLLAQILNQSEYMDLCVFKDFTIKAK